MGEWPAMLGAQAAGGAAVSNDDLAWLLASVPLALPRYSCTLAAEATSFLRSLAPR
jgi:hypothetical protein